MAMRLRGIFFVCLLLTCSIVRGAQPEANVAYVQALARLYAQYHSATLVRDVFLAENSSGAKEITAAFEDWKRTSGLGEIESEFSRVLGSAVQKAESAKEANRARMRTLLATQQKGRWSPGDLVTLLKSPAFETAQKYSADIQLVRAAMKGPTGTSPAGAHSNAPLAGATSAPKSLVIYTVPQLNTLYGKVYRETPGNDVAKRNAAAAHLKDLGLIAVEGLIDPEKGRTLIYSDDTFEAAKRIYLRTEQTDFRPYDFKGREVVVAGRVSKVDVFIELAEPRFVANPQELSRSKIAVERAGLKRKAIDREVFRVEPGKGIRPEEIEGVYTRMNWSLSGVGGSMVAEWDPYLVLKDGWFYSDPLLAPECFNAKLSREKEPQKWGKWKKEGMAFVVEWLEERPDGTKTARYADLTRLDAAPKGARLRGEISAMRGGGNTAFGGNTAIAAVRSYTFFPDGRFIFGATVGGGGGNDYSGEGPNVAFSSTAADKRGRYEVGAWGLVLTFETGEVRPLLFALIGNDGLDAVMLGQTAYTGAGKILK
jgi:hypothetical protein